MRWSKGCIFQKARLATSSPCACCGPTSRISPPKRPSRLTQCGPCTIGVRGPPQPASAGPITECAQPCWRQTAPVAADLVDHLTSRLIAWLVPEPGDLRGAKRSWATVAHACWSDLTREVAVRAIGPGPSGRVWRAAGPPATAVPGYVRGRGRRSSRPAARALAYMRADPIAKSSAFQMQRGRFGSP